MRKLLFQLHLYLAMIAGVFILILAGTGAIMAFEPELDRLFHWKMVYVTLGTQKLSLAALGQAVEKAFPGERATGFGLSTAPDLAASVTTRRGQVMVNPYDGSILGVRPPGPDFLSLVHQFHLRLLIPPKGDVGKNIVSTAAVVLLFLLVSGLYLWWPLKRLTVSGRIRGRRWWFDLHNAVGVFSLVFLLLLAFTGVIIGFEGTTVPMLYKITGSVPSRQPELPAPPVGVTPIGVDRAIEIAASALPGTVPFQVNVPERKGAYLVRARHPEDLTPGGRSRVVIDQYTGAILFAEDSRTAPGGARLLILNRALHTGDIFGVPSKSVMSLACVMAVLQVFSGAVMWWKRKVG